MTFLIFCAGIVALLVSGRIVNHVIETREDEREERQANERREQRHRHKLEQIEKLETVVSILIADRSIAHTLRDKIDEEYPRVRVQEVEEEDEDDTRKVRRKGKRR